MADDKKTPAQQLLDVLFFAPLGVAATVRDELPKLVQRGQQEANLAKMLGQFAVAMGKVEAEKLANRVVETVVPKPAPREASASASTSSGSGAGVTGSGAGGGGLAAGGQPPPNPTGGDPPPPTPVRTAGTQDGSGAKSVPVVDLDALGIPNYDSLSASQVVQRLAGLSPSELNAVEAYEAAHRARRTILNRVGQLRTA
ncbi:MAG TPA: hypothetical protein VNB24_09515 [Acidimicrobiales bacterium]|nr:hypothetical protein [Acidimicrobiales bacterium]